MKRKIKFPEIQRGDVFTLGNADAFGVCIKHFPYGIVSAFFLNQARIDDADYISLSNIAHAREHTEWGFLTEGWKVEKNITLHDDWHDPIRLRDSERAFMGSMDFREVTGADIGKYRLHCDGGLAGSIHILRSLCQVVLERDTMAGRWYRSPHIQATVPDGFLEYCSEMQDHWKGIFAKAEERRHAKKTRAEMWVDGEI
jgi:hypothetical protein